MTTTSPFPPTVGETVERVKREILADIGTAVSSRGDIMPEDIGSYSELHEYVDANTYGGMCDDGFRERFPRQDGDGDPMTDDPWMVHCNEVQDEVDEWLKAGRPGHVVLVSTEALGLLHMLLDCNDDDEELAENSGASLATVTSLRDAVAAALTDLNG